MPQEQTPEENAPDAQGDHEKRPLKPLNPEWAALVDQFGDKSRLREASYGNRPNLRPNNMSSQTSQTQSPPPPASNSTPSADDHDDGVELIVYGKSGRDRQTLTLGEMNALLDQEEAERLQRLKQREKYRPEQGEGPSR